MLVAVCPDTIVETLPVPVMAVEQMAVQISALFAQGDQVLGIELERRREMERRYVVHLELRTGLDRLSLFIQLDFRPTPLALRLPRQVLFLNPMPLRASQMSRFALDDVVDEF